MFALRTGCAPKVHNRLRNALAVPLPPRQPLQLSCAWKAIRQQHRTPASRPTNTAETLRALQERAQAALAAQRARMGQLETQLTAQLDSISAAISDQLSTQADDVQRADQSSSQIAQLQYELDETKAAWTRERQQLAADHANRSQLLEKQRAELEVRADELTISRRDLESRQQALDDRATQLNGQERELRHLQDELEGRAQESARQQSQFTALENDLQNREAELGTARTILADRTGSHRSRASQPDRAAGNAQEQQPRSGR